MDEELQIRILWEEKQHFNSSDPTTKEIYLERMAICKATGTNPFEVMNFWEGLEGRPGIAAFQANFEDKRFGSNLHEDYFA